MLSLSFTILSCMIRKKSCSVKQLEKNDRSLDVIAQKYHMVTVELTETESMETVAMVGAWDRSYMVVAEKLEMVTMTDAERTSVEKNDPSYEVVAEYCMATVVM